jgi:hypothetical protein
MKPEDIVTAIDTAATTLRASLDRNERKTTIEKFMAAFGPTGQWAFAPKSEKDKAQRAINAELDARSSEALFALGKLTHTHEPEIVRAIDTSRRAPSAEDAWSKRVGRSGALNTDTYLLLLMRDELQQLRIGPMLKAAQPTEWRRLYDAALADDTQQDNATTIRVIEDTMAGDSWPGAPLSSKLEAREAAAVLSLRQRIDDVREARVPSQLRDALAAIRRGRQLEEHVETIVGIRPRNPELEPRVPLTVPA